MSQRWRAFCHTNMRPWRGSVVTVVIKCERYVVTQGMIGEVLPYSLSTEAIQYERYEGADVEVKER